MSSKEPVARLVNDEEKSSGHMWAERFGCRELTDDGETLISSVYNDLQQVKCGAADSLAESNHSSIQLRLRAWAAREANESVDAFNKKKVDSGEEHNLPPEVGEELLGDSWLMPVSADSPMQLMRKETDEGTGEGTS
ncbi:MAG: hypothetical protein GY924_24030, partial [Planctomycetaceae bacterium]|nr:hypothetical protein [Planctomycetaceae bacterium]